jgi:hypothetical protein
MVADETKITVKNLIQTLDRIDLWLQALRKGLEALPQNQEIEVEDQEIDEALRRRPQVFAGC